MSTTSHTNAEQLEKLKSLELVQMLKEKRKVKMKVDRYVPSLPGLTCVTSFPTPLSELISPTQT